MWLGRQEELCVNAALSEAADDDDLDLNYQRAHLNNTSTDEFKTVNPLIKHGKKIQKGFSILRIQK